MDETNDILEEIVLQDVETIKVFADERRLQIVQLMQQPATVKDIATALQIPASKLYYHVNMLHEHGLIRVVQHNIESGIVEKVYQVTARQFKLQNPMLMGDAIPGAAKDTLFSSMLDETRTTLGRALRDGIQDNQTPPRYPFVTKKALRLNEAQLTTFHQKLAALIQETTALAEANADTSDTAYELTVVFTQNDQQSTQP
ncbi:MAG: winged helix-turn-helix domain-containing protein [Chloroflexota bacterium]